MPFSLSSVSLRPQIALVEDEAVLRRELAFQLGHLGFCVEACADAAQLYRQMAVRQFAAVVLDIGLDGEDGLSVCRYLRDHDNGLGIVFVTARGLRDDRLQGLDMGADAYLVKPVDIDELALILRRLAERRGNAGFSRGPAADSLLLAGQWEVDAATGFLVVPGGGRVRLTLNELKLVSVLFRRRGDICSHGELGQALGQLPEEYDKHRIEVVLSRLRDKVRRETGLTLPVQVARNVGYALLA